VRRLLVGYIGLVAAGAVLVVPAAGAGGPVAFRTPGPSAALGVLRPWGGTEIRSLDPPPAARAARSASAEPSASTAGPAPTSGTPPPADQVLSDESTFTRWAYAASTGPIYRQPSSTSARMARLRWYTEDGFPEVYILLRSHWDAKGHEWIMVRVPKRPNGSTGWVRVEDLDTFHVTHVQIVVNRSRLRMYFFARGRLMWSAPVAVGKSSTPTPAGHFWIRERFKIADPRSGYWPYAFGTSDYSTLTDWPGGGVVGIHGPYHQPQNIPGRVSHGCVRLRTADDAWLARHVGLGTPVRVL
jgi:L,D-transpeptidase catalytic domain